jgi:pimeloyl-ACP methyl ester carboxylesterase
MKSPKRPLRNVLLSLLVLSALLVVGGIIAILAIDPVSQANDLPDRAFEPHSRFIPVAFAGNKAVDVHYLEKGPQDFSAIDAKHPVFVLLHGFTFNAFTWEAQMSRLADHGRVIAFDQLPYGLSAKALANDPDSANPYDRESAVALVLAVMDALGVENAILVGSSSGGTLALEVASQAPHRVDALVLVAPWVFAQRPTIPRWLAESTPLRRLSLFIARQLGGRGGLLDASYADPGKITDERRRLAGLHQSMRNWDLAWAAMLNRSLSTPIDISERLAQIDQPALVLTGDADGLVPLDDSLRVAQGLANGESIVLPGCGHVPHEECPDAFYAVLDAWLTSRKDAD